jgi:hypothetical protein
VGMTDARRGRDARLIAEDEVRPHSNSGDDQMADTTHDMEHPPRHRPRTHRRLRANAAIMGLVCAALGATPLAAQSIGRAAELGVDAGAVFGLGSQSSIDVNLPGSRFRIGFFNEGSQVSIEPAFGFGYNKVEGVDGLFRYDLELGVLYHFAPMVTATTRRITTRVTTPYLRPFVGVTGFSGGGGSSDSEVTAGAGLGVKIPWRTDLAWRLEANLGYGFDNKAGRIGTLLGLSYFPR